MDPTASAAGIALSPLERLPAELRNRIYALVVVDSHDLDISKAIRQPALAATNSNIRGEILPIFYGENKFMVDVSDLSGPGGDIELEEVLEEYATYTTSMKQIGAYDPTPPAPLNYSKLSAHIKDDGTVQFTFYDIDCSTPACVCQIKKIFRGDHDDMHPETLPARLLRASALDLDRTMELVLRGYTQTFARYQ